MIASKLRLSRADSKALKISDAYSLHRVVYDLFDDVRSDSEKAAGVSSGILFVDKGGDFQAREILLLSDRAPNQPTHGELASREIPSSFLEADAYRFEIVMNPVKRENQSRKLVAIKGREAVQQWFVAKAPRWGFSVHPSSLQINQMSVQVFEKKGQTVTLGSVTLQGELSVSDRTQFIKSFEQGIGRGHAFGFGLLQISPISNPFSF